MAEHDPRIHGNPIAAKSSTGESPVEGEVRARLTIAFDLDLRNFGGPLIPNIVPPTRIIVEVARALAGEEAVRNLPPQPNTLFGRFLLPPGGKKK